MLWLVEAADLPRHSYLLGTMHVQDTRAFVWKNAIEAALDHCEQVATEAPIDDLAQLSAQMDVYLPEGQRLSQLIRPHRYRKLAKIIQKTTGLPLQSFDRLRPMMLQNMISESMLQREQSVSLDAYIWSQGKARDLTCVGIESADTQIRILQQLPIQQQVKDLLDFGQHFGGVQRNINRMANLYAEGDYQQLYKLTKRSLGKLRKVLLYQRNAKMVDRITELVQAQPTFCAIGAAHLAGEKGVLRGLKHQGFRLKQLKA